MKRSSVILLASICFLFITGVLSHAGEDRSSKIILDNGMTVLMTEMPSSPVVSVYAFVKAGSATEGKYLGTGISHFLEHMLFKGTHGRGVGEIASRIQAVGGEINAATSKDYTIYTITVPYEQFDVALEILADMLMNSKMDAQEVEKEREVIFSEIRLHDDNPASKIQEIIYKNVYLNHPYRHPIIGYEALLAEVSREDLIDYYHRNYVPNNTIFAIAGNFDMREITPKIKAAFKDFKRGRSLMRNLPSERAQISRRHYEEEYSTDLARLSMTFSGINLLHPDLYALDVLAGILGQGRSSRLYLNVYKKENLVHSISSYNYTPVDRGIFSIECLLEQENINATIASVFDQIAKIKVSGVNREELEKVKQQVKSEHVLDRQTASSVNYSQAFDEAFTGDPEFSEKYVEAISRVTLEDIKRVANTYLIESGLTTIVLKPKQDGAIETKRQISVDEGSIEKHVLSNGLTVLIKEDHTFPLVSLRLSAQGGVRQESEALNGLSQLMSSAWIKGTKKYTADQIAEMTESLGMGLGSFSGRNSFGLSMEFLAEQLPVALDLFQELIVYPNFPEGEIQKIKETTKAAIRQREDDIFKSTAYVLRQELFLTHPYRLEQEGTLVSVDAIQRKDLVDFYARFAVPGNMVMSVFGDMDSGTVLKDLEKKFGVMKARSVTLGTFTEAPLDGSREQEYFLDKEQAMVMFGFHGAVLGDEDVYGLEVAVSILGSSFSGRIFNNIRDQLGSAYTLGGNFIPGPDAGMVYFYVITTADNVEKVKELVKKEIRILQAEIVPESELKDIKAYLKGTFRSSQETAGALSFMTGLDELYGLGFENYRKYDTQIDQVTQEEIRDIAQRYLDLEKVAIVVTLPKVRSDN